MPITKTAKIKARKIPKPDAIKNGIRYESRLSLLILRRLNYFSPGRRLFLFFLILPGHDFRRLRLLFLWKAVSPRGWNRKLIWFFPAAGMATEPVLHPASFAEGMPSNLQMKPVPVLPARSRKNMLFLSVGSTGVMEQQPLEYPYQVGEQLSWVSAEGCQPDRPAPVLRLFWANSRISSVHLAIPREIGADSGQYSYPICKTIRPFSRRQKSACKPDPGSFISGIYFQYRSQ